MGAAIALSLQQIVRRFGRSGLRAQRLKNECVQILVFAEDLRDRVVAGQPGGWDSRAYRLAKSRLRTFDPSVQIQAALADLDETRVDLAVAWRLSGGVPAQERGDLALAVQALEEAIARFATSSSVLVRVSLFQVPMPRVKLVSALAALLPECVEDRVEQHQSHLLEERPCVLARHVARSVGLHRAGHQQHV